MADFQRDLNEFQQQQQASMSDVSFDGIIRVNVT